MLVQHFRGLACRIQPFQPVLFDFSVSVRLIH